jgi:hypothetical protein
VTAVVAAAGAAAALPDQPASEPGAGPDLPAVLPDPGTPEQQLAAPPDQPAAAPPDQQPAAPAEQPPAEQPPAEQPAAAPPEGGVVQTQGPAFLNRPLETGPDQGAGPVPAPGAEPDPDHLLLTHFDRHTGFSGKSSVLPEEEQTSSHFVPIEDRWRLGFPEWDRYGKGHPVGDDYPYDPGAPLNPFKQNVLKGDYPIIGQHTFLEITAISHSVMEPRQIPAQTGGFESTANPFQEEFFGRPNQFFDTHFTSVTFDLFHGDAAFKPVDWRIHVTPVFDVNHLAVEELAIVNPDVRRGTTRGRTWFALQEWFVEAKLADLSPNYDFVSIRAGSQPFNHDFRGFIFFDTNRAVRLFGTLEANRDQFNLIYFKQLEKETNSELNTFGDRNQDVLAANFYRQDTIWPGYTSQVSILYDHDRPSVHTNRNDVPVRPDPVGVHLPHDINVVYLGWAGDGHINRFNIDHAFYWALGRDSMNPIAGRPVDINAKMLAIELSYDRDWMRFRTSYFYASGDGDPNNSQATGFDSVLDNTQFAGGQFSYWQRQGIPLFGVNLTNPGSLLPDLRSSKIEGQVNFVNPGIHILNFGFDMDLTPQLRMINNFNFLWFDEVNVLEVYLFDDHIKHYIGADLSVGFEYRPLVSNNIIMTFGVSMLIPGAGFKDLYNNLRDNRDPLLASFLDVVLAF